MSKRNQQRERVINDEVIEYVVERHLNTTDVAQSLIDTNRSFKTSKITANEFRQIIKIYREILGQNTTEAEKQIKETSSKIENLNIEDETPNTPPIQETKPEPIQETETTLEEELNLLSNRETPNKTVSTDEKEMEISSTPTKTSGLIKLLQETKEKIINELNELEKKAKIKDEEILEIKAQIEEIEETIITNTQSLPNLKPLILNELVKLNFQTKTTDFGKNPEEIKILIQNILDQINKITNEITQKQLIDLESNDKESFNKKIKEIQENLILIGMLRNLLFLLKSYEEISDLSLQKTSLEKRLKVFEAEKEEIIQKAFNYPIIIESK